MKKNIIIALIFIMSLSLFAETVVLLPSDDMYSDPEHSETEPVVTELWTANYTQAGHFERIMIKFDLDEYLGADLESAVLKLTRFFSCPTTGTTVVTFFAINQNWNEEEWDYGEHISYNEYHSMDYVFSGNGGSYIQDFNIDITEFLRSWFENDLENNGFVIIANNNQRFSKFYSKEFSNETYRPKLEMTYEYTAVDEQLVHDPAKMINLYPNPLKIDNNGQNGISILFELKEPLNVKISVYNIKGQLVKRLMDEYRNKGNHRVSWNGLDKSGSLVNSGIYLCRLNTAKVSKVQQILLIK